MTRAAGTGTKRGTLKKAKGGRGGILFPAGKRPSILHFFMTSAVPLSGANGQHLEFEDHGRRVGQALLVSVGRGVAEPAGQGSSSRRWGRTEGVSVRAEYATGAH